MKRRLHRRRPTHWPDAECAGVATLSPGNERAPRSPRPEPLLVPARLSGMVASLGACLSVRYRRFQARVQFYPTAEQYHLCSASRICGSTIPFAIIVWTCQPGFPERNPARSMSYLKRTTAASEMSCDAEFHMGTLFCGAFVLDRPSVSSVISGGIMHFKFKRCNKFDSIVLLFYTGRFRHQASNPCR